MKEKCVEILDKIYRKLHPFFYHRSKSRIYRYCMYGSYRHYRKYGDKKSGSERNLYLTAVPNRGAGIGHQMDGWMAGVIFAQRWGIAYAYSPFANQKWDRFLGFGEGLTTARELLKKKQYRRVKLPYFDEQNLSEVDEIEKIVRSYAGEKIVFYLELDQFCSKRYELIEYLRERFMKASARKEDVTFYESGFFNIAVHVRRGDIVGTDGKVVEEYRQRWLSIDYYLEILDTLTELLTNEDLRIYIFSQGNKEDFKEFDKYQNVSYCLDESEQETFGNLVNSDLLVMGKSSFSYDAALIQRGIRIYPNSFWGTCPESKWWIRLDDSGRINEEQKKSISELILEKRYYAESKGT